MSRRLQTYYGISNPSASFNGLKNQNDGVSSLKGFEDEKPRGGVSSIMDCKLHGTEEGGSVNEIDKSSMQTSEGVEGDQSQITNPRHIVFFRTSIRMKDDFKPDAQLSYIPQGGFFNARNGNKQEETDNQYYIGINKRFINSTDMIQSRQATNRGPTTPQKAKTMIKMSQGIERNKIRDIQKLDPRQTRTGFQYHRGSPKIESPERQKSHNLPKVELGKRLIPPLNPQKSYGGFQTQPTTSSFFTMLSNQGAAKQAPPSRNLLQSSLLGAFSSKESRNIPDQKRVSAGSSKNMNIKEIFARRAQQSSSKSLKGLMKLNKQAADTNLMDLNISQNKLPV